MKAEQTKEKKSSRKGKNKFHGKLGNYSEVRTFEEDTAAKRKPHHLVLSWHIMEMRDLPHLALLDHLHADVNDCISGCQFFLMGSESPNTLIINAP